MAVITTTLNSGVVLSPSQNPLLITATGAIHATDTPALLGPQGTNWMVRNLGTLTAAGTGFPAAVYLSAGTFANGASTDPHSTSALVSSAGVGVAMAGAGSQVRNFGTITAASAGVELMGGGAVLNSALAGHGSHSSALIQGGAFGVEVVGGTGTVANLGTILATGGVGVYLSAGTVTNGNAALGNTSALISGSAGAPSVEIHDIGGRVANYGTIGGGGVSLQNGGTVINGSSADRQAYISTIASSATAQSYGQMTIDNSGKVGTILVNPSNYQLETIVNGSAADTSATIGGISGGYFNGSVDVTNFGTISNAYLTGLQAVRNYGVIGELKSVNIYAAAVPPAQLTNFGSIGTIDCGLSFAFGVTNHGMIGTVSGSAAYGLSADYIDFISNFGSIGDVANFVGSIYNGSSSDSAAIISGTVDLAAGTITNFGTLGLVALGFGTLAASTTLLNGSSGVILGGVQGSGVGTDVVNNGTIIGTIGVDLVAGAGRLTDGGVIIGTSGVAVDFADGNARLILDAGASFVGAVTAGGAAASNVLELATAGGPGTIAGIGTSITNFGSIAIDSGASWSLAGFNDLASNTVLSIASGATLAATGSVTSGATVTLLGNGALTVSAGGNLQIGTGGHGKSGQINVDVGSTLNASGTLAGVISDNGQINAGMGTLTLTSGVSGKGAIGIDANSVLNAAALSVRTIGFIAGGNETLRLGRPHAVSSTLTGFGNSPGNTIDLVGIIGTAVHFASNKLSVTEGGGGLVTLKLTGNYTSSQFAIGTDHHGGTDVTFV